MTTTKKHNKKNTPTHPFKPNTELWERILVAMGALELLAGLTLFVSLVFTYLHNKPQSPQSVYNVSAYLKDFKKLFLNIFTYKAI